MNFGGWFASGRNSRSRSMVCGDRNVTFFQEHTHTHSQQTVVETAVEKKRSTIKYWETEYAKKFGAEIPKPSLKKKRKPRRW